MIARAADVAGLPSAQAEIDRGRLVATLGKARRAARGTVRDAPGRAALDEPRVPPRRGGAHRRLRRRGLVPDLLGRPRGAGPAGAEGRAGRSRCRRGTTRTRPCARCWPSTAGPGRCCSGRDLAARLRLEPRSVLLVARGGWTQAVLQAPFGPELGSAIAAPPASGRPGDRAARRAGTAGRSTARRSRRRPACSRRASLRGRTSPFRPSSRPAVEAFRAGRAAEAPRRSTRSRPGATGGCCPPEARLNRALCLARARPARRGAADPAAHRRQPLRGRDRPAARGVVAGRRAVIRSG